MLSNNYELFKALHVISVISWMAGLLYLPRLFVYHAKEDIEPETYQTFLIMERKLLRFITVPAMILTYIFGILCSYIYGMEALGTWFHLKVGAIFGLTIFNGMVAIWYQDFLHKENKHSQKFFKIVNEIPTILMMIAVFMVILKPFE